MKRTLLLVAGVLACCFATACKGELAGDDDSNGSSQGAIGSSGKGTAESEKGTASGGGQKPGDASLDPCPADGKPGDPGPGKPGEQGACFTFDPGDVCSTPDDLKLAATKICGSKDAVAVQIGFDAKGGCSVTCCTDGPPPPPPDACTWTAVGDGTTCISDVDLKTKAVTACAGSELHSIYPAGDCANGATIAKVECCSANPGPTKGPGVVSTYGKK